MTAPQGKQRHGCLIAWLCLMTLAFLLTLAGGIAIGSGALEPANGMEVPSWVPIVQVVLGLAGIACVVGLFMLKKWGFFGFVGIAVIAAVTNIASGTPAFLALLFPVIGIGLLYLVLQIGKENKGWTQLD